MELLQLSIHTDKKTVRYDFAALASNGVYHLADEKAYAVFCALIAGADVKATLWLSDSGVRRRFPIDYPLHEREKIQAELSSYVLDLSAAEQMLLGQREWFDEKRITDFLQAVAKCEELPKLKRARMLEAAGGENVHQLSFLADCLHHRQLSLCAVANAHMEELTGGHYRLMPQEDGFMLLDMHTATQFSYQAALDELQYFAALSFALAFAELEKRCKMPMFPLITSGRKNIDTAAKTAVRSYFYRLVKSGKQS